MATTLITLLALRSLVRRHLLPWLPYSVLFFPARALLILFCRQDQTDQRAAKRLNALA